MPLFAPPLPSHRTGPLVLLLLGLILGLGVAPPTAVQAQPAFSKAFRSTPIGPGSETTLVFTIDNSASGTRATDLAFTDNLPGGVTIASPANATNTCTSPRVSPTLSAPDGGSTITFTDGIVAAGGTCTVSVDVTSSIGGLYTNVSGDLTSSAGNSGAASADLTVDTDRPGFAKQFAPTSVSLGERSTLTFTIDNAANPSDLFEVRFSDRLPSGLEVANPTGSATTCNGGSITADPGTRSISYVASFNGTPALAAGATCTVSVDVIPTTARPLVNSSDELTSLDGSTFARTSSGKANAALTVTADDLGLTKTFVDDPATIGGTATLEFSVTNRDRAHTATSMSFTDDLDATLSGLVATGLPATDVCGPGSELSGTSTLTLTGGTLPAGETCTFRVSLQLPAAGSGGTYPNTTSPITATVDGQAVSGGPASDDLFVVPITLSKTFLDAPVSPGETFSLEFTATNTSASAAASEISFTDDLDATLGGLSPTSLPADGFCGSGSRLVSQTQFDGGITLTMTGGQLGPGASCTFEVPLQVPADAPGGTYTNTTSDITATIDGTTYAGRPATDAFSIPLGLTLTDGSADGLDFASSVSAGTSNNPIGAFSLSAPKNGATLDAVTITNATPGVEGVSAVRLFWSADPSLDVGSDTELGEVTTDPSSAPAEITFDGLAQSIPPEARYALLALDVQSGASADVQFTLAQTNALSLTNGDIASVNGQASPPYPLSNSTTALPVELAGFDAQARGSESVTLRWQTASETNNAGFEIQRLVKPSSTTGMTSGPQDGSTSPSEITDGWETVGSVDGAGTTTEVQSYAFTDTGVPYDADSLTYRLKQVDLDGSVSYSEARTVARSTVKQVRLLGTYPNPARSRATVRFAIPDGSAQEVTLRLYDVLGRQVRTVRAGAEAGRHELTLDTSRLPNGTYFLRLTAGGTTRTQQVTVVQ